MRSGFLPAVYLSGRLLLGLAGSGLIAQTALSPEDAVRLSLQHNAYLTAAASRIRAADGMRMQAGLKPNARLFLQSENARIPDSTPFRYAQDTDNFAYLARVFEVGGKRDRRIELASENVAAAGISADMQRAQIAARVLLAYWDVVSAQRLASVLADSLRILEQTVDFQAKRVREGALPEADLLRVQIERQQLAIHHKSAEQGVRRLLQFLYREIGTQPESQVALTGDLAAGEPVVVEDLGEAVERRKDIQLAVQAVIQARAALHLQKANGIPDPELLFGYKRTAGLNTVIAGLQINLPFQNRNQGAIAAAEAEEAASVASLRAGRIAARTEIGAIVEEYRQKREVLEQMLPNLRGQAEETRRIATEVYREGASDLLRLLDAERLRIDAETLYVRSALEYRQAEVQLRAALGQLP